VNWYLSVIKNYAGFSGRARRQEFWMFVLFNVIAAAILAIVDAVVGTSLLIILYWLAVLLPTLAVTVRRLHDTGRSGFWIFLGFIPLVGGIILIVFYALEGQPSDNQYGPNPKQEQPAYV
jgi:uncharacterized membrane protein YhaH (DUF805 family)